MQGKKVSIFHKTFSTCFRLRFSSCFVSSTFCKNGRVSRKEFLKQLEMQTSAQEITHVPMRNAPWPSTPMRATEPQRQRAKTVCETCREVASLQRHWVTFGCVLLSTEARITNLGTNKISQMPHIKLSDPLHQTTTASRRNRKRTL